MVWDVAQSAAGLGIGVLGASVIAAYTVVNRRARTRGPRAHWWWGLVLGAGGTTLLGLGWVLLAAARPRLGLGWLRLVGVALAAVSLLVYALSARRVGRWKAPSRYGLGLRTEGIYARVRHPQALSLTILVVALTFLGDSLPYLLTAPLWLAFWVAYTYVEESWELLPTFGDAYRDYMRRTPRLVPRWGPPKKGGSPLP